MWGTKQRFIVPLLTTVLSIASFPLRCGAFDPQLLWRTSLPGSTGTLLGPGLRKGNGVVASKDGNSLWVTDEFGSLYVFDVNNPLSDSSTIKFRLSARSNTTMECRSSVSLHETGNGVEYAVYTVIDTPKANQDFNASSRVIAVNAKGASLGTIRWKRKIDGVAVGTPVIGSDGKFVYVTHNTKHYGSMTQLRDTTASAKGGKISSVVTGSLSSQYGPPVIATTADEEDYVYWGEMNQRGYSDIGRIHYLETSTLIHHIGTSTIGSSSVVPPTISSDRSKMWMGGKASTVYGWTGTFTSTFEGSPSWTTQLVLSRRNATYPIMNRIIESKESDRIFVASASNSFHCLDALNGVEIWNNTHATSVFLTSAKYSAAHDVVYSIQHSDGTIIQQNATNGNPLWSMGCFDITGNAACQDSVEAEFSLSPDEATLYFADIFGNINAISLAKEAPPVENEPPSTWPSSLPTENSLSTRPSIAPTLPPTTTFNISTELPSTSALQTSPPTNLLIGNLSLSPTMQIKITHEPTVIDDDGWLRDILINGSIPVADSNNDSLPKSGSDRCDPAYTMAFSLATVLINLF